jgi:predicted secreted hydrolase
MHRAQRFSRTPPGATPVARYASSPPARSAFTPLRHWASPRSGASYPVQIEIRLGELTLRTRPVLDDQELSTSRPAPVVYWEGLVRLEGSLSGRGYLEMTGYAGRLQL